MQVAQNWQTDDLIHCRLRAFGARQVVLQPPCLTVHQSPGCPVLLVPGLLIFLLRQGSRSVLFFHGFPFRMNQAKLGASLSFPIGASEESPTCLGLATRVRSLAPSLEHVCLKVGAVHSL